MATKLKNGNYACSFCGRSYANMVEADSCRGKHNLIYFPLTKPELSSILQFIFTRDEELITEALVKRLQKYSRAISISPLTTDE